MKFTWTQLYFQIPFVVSLVCSLYLLVRRPKSLEFRESLASLSTSLLVRLITANVPIYFYAYSVRKWGYTNRLLEIPFNAYSFVLYFFAAEFFFYWIHRLGHSFPLFWVGHGPHHTGKVMTPALIMRTSIFEGFWSPFLLIPTLLCGFSIYHYSFFYSFIFIHQSLCHTEINWPKFLDRFLVTPKIHRLHHSYAPTHINRNFGGVTCIFDRLFGTYVNDDKAPCYGISDGLNSRNPLVLMFHLAWQLILKTFSQIRNLFRGSSIESKSSKSIAGNELLG